MLSEKMLMFLELAVSELEGDSSSNEGQAAEGTTTEVVEGQEASIDTPSEYDVDGEKLTLEQIREYKQGFLRQSDYTKKTQEIARFRQENNDALELYNYLRDNPHIAEQLANLSPEQASKTQELANPALKEINDIKIQLKTQEIDRQLNDIKAKDNMVNEVELLELATKHSLPIDMAYNIWRGQNMDKVIEKKLAEQSAKLTEQIKSNNGVTKTLITPKDSNNSSSITVLSPQQKAMAEKLGMSEEEYIKWM